MAARPSRGWMTSVLLALSLACLTWGLGSKVGKWESVADDPGVLEMSLTTMAFVLVAMEGVQSDLLSSERAPCRFFCGNFGLEKSPSRALSAGF